MSEKERFDIVCFGECVIDHISQISQKGPQEFSMRISNYKVLFGGRGLNFAATAKIFTPNVLLISAVGVDYASSGLKEYLKTKDICDSRFYRTQKYDLPQAFIYNHGSNSSIYFYPGLWAKAEAEVKTYLNRCIDSVRAKVIYCTSGSPDLNLHLLKNFTSKFRVFAPGHELYIYNRDQIINLLINTNALFLNQTEYLLLEDKLDMKINKILSNYDLDLVVITLGHRGSRLISKEQLVGIPACTTDYVVDQTGAGDGFAAAFLATYLAGGNLKYSTQIASVTSSFLIEASGGHANLPSYELIKKRYKENL